ncbi:MAG: universal stress protein [Vicinamibacterales bacterium]|jgi:nucleotide-binding universal stress UspA family protein
MQHILLHGGSDEAYDRSVIFARRLAESFGAQLHILYTVDDPVGWVEEIRPEQLPEVHQAIEEEALDRLASLIPPEEQERLHVNLVIRTGPAQRELTRFTEEQQIDLAILQAPLGNEQSVDLAHALIDHGRCAVLVLR